MSTQKSHKQEPKRVRVTRAESTATGELARGVNRTRWKNAVHLSEQFGGVVKFGERVGVSKQQASHMWGKNPVRNIGTANAARIEEAAGVPSGWLDIDHEQERMSEAVPRAAMYTGGGRVEPVRFEQPAQRASGLQLRPIGYVVDWVRHQLPSVEPHSMQLVMEAGSSMSQTVPPTCIAVLNTAITSIVDDGVYLLEFSGMRVLRRAALQLDGSLVLTSEARGVDPIRVDRGFERSLRVIGRVVSTFSINPV